jgi:hypothetical protein
MRASPLVSRARQGFRGKLTKPEGFGGARQGFEGSWRSGPRFGRRGWRRMSDSPEPRRSPGWRGQEAGSGALASTGSLRAGESSRREGRFGERAARPQYDTSPSRERRNRRLATAARIARRSPSSVDGDPRMEMAQGVLGRFPFSPPGGLQSCSVSCRRCCALGIFFGHGESTRACVHLLLLSPDRPTRVGTAPTRGEE